MALQEEGCPRQPEKKDRERGERDIVRNGGERMREKRERSHGNTADSATPRPVVD